MSNTELDPMLAVYRSLPPGLELPSADESTEQYKIENFRPRSLEDLTKYGEFMIALMVCDVWINGKIQRTSLMPTEQDFEDMYKAGYGVGRTRIARFGGVRAVQKSLHFYPDGLQPESDELQKRFTWMAENAYRPNVDFIPSETNIEQVILWGAARDLLPTSKIIYKVLGGDTTEIRKTFLIDRAHYREQNTYFDLYQLGNKVLEENDGPLNQHELEEKYGHLFSGSLPMIITEFFGGTNKFWLEFDRIADAHGMTDQEVVNVGIWHAIATGNPRITKSLAAKLSAEKRFPFNPVSRIGFIKYQKLVDEGYKTYQHMREQFEARGISPEAFDAACQRFEPTSEFEDRLQRNTDVLRRLSGVGARATFLRERIQHGLELDSRAVYTWRLSEIHKVLKAWELDEDQKRFVFDLIPRLNTDEAMDAGPPPTPANDAAYSIHPRPWSRSIRTGSEL